MYVHRYIHVQYNNVSRHTKYVVFTYNSHTYHGPLSLCNGGRGYLVSRAPHIITPSKRHCNCRQRKHLFIPCLAQKSRSHIHLLFYMIYIKNKLFYMKTSLTRSLIFIYTCRAVCPSKCMGFARFLIYHIHIIFTRSLIACASGSAAGTRNNERGGSFA